MEYLSSTTISQVSNNLSKIEITQEQYKLMWRSLNEQRKEGQFCDIVIKCKESAFYAHKCVLASISSYFATLFTSLLATENEQVANLHQFPEKCIELLLEIIYNQANVETTDLVEM